MRVTRVHLSALADCRSDERPPSEFRQGNLPGPLVRVQLADQLREITFQALQGLLVERRERLRQDTGERPGRALQDPSSGRKNTQLDGAPVATVLAAVTSSRSTNVLTRLLAVD